MRIFALAGMLLSASASLATPIVYEFSGYISESYTTQPTPLDVDLAGTRFTGSVIYETSSTCGDSQPPIHVCSGAGTTWQVIFGDYVLTSLGPHVVIRQNDVGFQFGQNILSPLVLDGWRLLAQSDTYLNLTGNFNEPLTDVFDSFPQDLDWVTGGNFYENAFVRPATQTSDGIRWNFGGTISSFHRVPEPPTAVLLTIALLCLAGMPRKKA